MGSDVVDGERAVLNTVGVAADDGTVVGMVGLGVLEVSRAIIVAEGNILRRAVLVMDKELR